ncbi:outer membrane beta-barrel protein [Flammeovirga sp. MY04]|uniref:outer membrane beta-barrel protein n=1 Tax=Flammeovirga sp. MY04 TaxID=1191459 RepID=UPI0008064328|nr:outer membrane beta-barrel protein [Flammeovirga sp. MY04]ANQ50650.1 outer membrane beta-barrel protein [Flammeovirga sp. MY04]
MVKLRKLLLPLIGVALLSFSSFGQEKKTDFYFSGGMEIIFSGMTANKINNQEYGNDVIRFAPVFNGQTYFNMDLGNHFGLFAGVSIKNLGFIFDVPDEYKADASSGTVRKKMRSYNVGVPVGIKVGNLNGFFLYGGYEIEQPIHYKEKTFVGGNKTNKFSMWFTDRVTTQQSVMLGVQFTEGLNLKFKYYLDPFFNESWGSDKENIHGTTLSYNQITGNVFYFSLNCDIFDTKRKINRIKKAKVSVDF